MWVIKIDSPLIPISLCALVKKDVNFYLQQKRLSKKHLNFFLTSLHQCYVSKAPVDRQSSSWVKNKFKLHLIFSSFEKHYV